MLKSEELRIQRLAKKNAEKAAREDREESKKKTPRKQEDESIEKEVEASEAHHLFDEMQKRPFVA
jgi:hypothetical protein